MNSVQVQCDMQFKPGATPHVGSPARTNAGGSIQLESQSPPVSRSPITQDMV